MALSTQGFIKFVKKLLYREHDLEDINWEEFTNKLNTFEELVPITLTCIEYGLEWISIRESYIREDM